MIKSRQPLRKDAMDRLMRFHGLVFLIHLLVTLGALGYIAMAPYTGQQTDPRYLFMLAPLGLCLAVNAFSLLNNWVGPVRLGFFLGLIPTLIYLMVVYISNPSVQTNNLLTMNQETHNFMLLGFWLYAMLFSAAVLVMAMLIPRKKRNPPRP